MYPHPYSLRRKHKKATNNQAKAEWKHEDEALDEALNQTFPASDPVAVSFDKDSEPDANRTPSWRPDKTAGLERQK